MRLAIYLAGKIQKRHEKGDEAHWTEEDLAQLRKDLPDFELVFLNPALRTDDLSDPFSLFGRDMLQIFLSDLVFVDARDRRGLGVGAEMMWAKSQAIPVLSLMPKNTHYHMEETVLLGTLVKNYIHPFVASLSDGIVEDLSGASKWISSFFQQPRAIKDLSTIRAAMQHYLDTQFERDLPMQEIPSSILEKIQQFVVK